MWDYFFASILLNLILIMMIAKVPEIIPIIVAKMKKMDYVVKLDNMNKMVISPAVHDGDRVLTSLAYKKFKWKKTGLFQSRDRDSFSLFGQRAILAYAPYATSVDPRLLAFIKHIKTELGITTNNQLMSLMDAYRLWSKPAENLLPEETATFEKISEKYNDNRDIKKAFDIIGELGSGYILSNIEYVKPSELYDLLTQIDPQAFLVHEENEVLAAKIGMGKPSNLITYIIIGAIVILALMMLSGGSSDSASTTASSASSMVSLI